ncbi:MAG TPA: efflux RND transporter periplasmic adaptor subunit [Steroidobacteraceae bacterium]|jgi:membrane fusion protein (multidrug efflux system)|nr:efflux RND transporter periplasmic adaptor subunit [Steroidobacteraceae bacterium]
MAATNSNNPAPSRVRPLFIVAVSLLGGLAAGCGAKQAKEGDKQPPEAGYVVLKREGVPLRLTLPGRTTAFESSEVRPQVSGIIQARLFTEGATVRAGEQLYRIDPRVYQSAAGEARADLNSAIALRDAARTRADRFGELAKSGVVSRQDLLDAQAAAESAAAAAERARASLATAEVNLSFTEVRAPIGGRIGRSFVTTGALVTSGQTTPLTTIQRLDPIFVDIQQSSSAVVAFRRQLAGGSLSRASTEVNLVLEDGSRYAHAGVLQFAESVVDMSTGTVTVRARFPNPESLLLPGMYVRAEFSPVEAREAILAPQQGISRDVKGNATAIVIGADSKAELRTVETERTVGDQWLVSRGLQPGDRLVVEGLGRIKPGQVVRPVEARRAASAPPRTDASDQAASGGTAAVAR